MIIFEWLKRKNIIVSGLLLTVGLALSLTNYYIGIDALNKDRQHSFESESILFNELLSNKLDNQITITETINVIEDNCLFDRNLFGNISDFFTTKEEGSYSYVKRVFNKTMFEYEQNLYWEPILGHKVFITERNDEGIIVPAKDRYVYYPVTYINPIEKNERAVLFDIYSEINRRTTINSAIDTGETVFSSRISLVQENVYGVLCMSPTSKKDIISTVLRINFILESVFKESSFSTGLISILEEVSSESFLGGIKIEDSNEISQLFENEITSIDQKPPYVWESYLHKAQKIWRFKTIATDSYKPINSSSIILTTVLIMMVFCALTVFYLLLVFNIEQKHVYVKDQLKASYNRWMGYMCHSLRSPIHTINYTSENLVKDGEIDYHKLELLQANTGQLFDLINSYIDLSTTDSRDITLIKRSTNICHVAENVFHEYTIMSSMSVKMRRSIPSELINTYIRIDPLRFRQILSNAINNAVKFTTRGKIELIIKLRDDEIEQKILFIIRDTGPGLRGRDENMLFHDYEQGEFPAQPVDKKMASSGLGLSISHYLASMMDGSVYLHNRRDGIRGSEFILELPFIPIDPSDSDGISNETPESGESNNHTVVYINPTKISQINICACEDDFSNQQIMKEMFSDFGIHKSNISIFDDGESLIYYLEDNQNLHKVHIIVLDIFLKRMNGDELFEELRNMGYKGPIIAVTGNVINTQEYLEQGFNEVLIKPYRARDLKRTIEKALGFKHHHIENN